MNDNIKCYSCDMVASEKGSVFIESERLCEKCAKEVSNLHGKNKKIFCFKKKGRINYWN